MTRRTSTRPEGYWTPARRKAHERNSAIRDLRMIYNRAQHAYFNPDECKTIQDIVDGVLKRLGAETETERREKRREELMGWRPNQ